MFVLTDIKRLWGFLGEHVEAFLCGRRPVRGPQVLVPVVQLTANVVQCDLSVSVALNHSTDWLIWLHLQT